MTRDSSRWRRPAGVTAAFAGEPLTTRLHTAIRWATSPMRAVESELPAAGSVLEIGCGHGMFALAAALGSPERRVVGTDIDGAKLVEARGAARHAGLGTDRLEFLEVEPDWRPPPEPRWDSIVVLDVLYLLGVDAALALTDAAARAVAPGGRLLIKEMDTEIRWKARITETQEFVSTRLTRVTEGDQLELVPLDGLRATMAAAGLTVSTRPLDRGYLWPHTLLVGQRSPG